MNNKFKIMIKEEFSKLKEALKDEIPSYMKDIISKRYKDADKYLDMDIPKHNEVIPNVKVEVNDSNITNKSIKEIVDYFQSNIIDQFKETYIYELLGYDELKNILKMSLGEPILVNKIEGLKRFYSKDFLLPETKVEDDKNVVFSKNKSNLYNLLLRLKKAYPSATRVSIDTNKFLSDKVFNGLRDVIVNYDENVANIKKSKLYLYISDKPDDKLRMSISKFYDSCQNIYSGGDYGTEYNKRLLSNVFDENSKVAYLMFDTTFIDQRGNTQPFTPIARCIIRVSEDKIMFDKVYPSDMEEIMYSIITDKTGMVNKGKKNDIYNIKKIEGLPTPYMDKYRLKTDTLDDEISAKIEVLGAYLGLDDESLKEVTQESETIFYYVNAEYYIDTYDNAIERARDSFESSADDYLYNAGYSILSLLNEAGEKLVMDFIYEFNETSEDDKDYEYDYNEVVNFFNNEYGLDESDDDLAERLCKLLIGTTNLNHFTNFYVDFDDFVWYFGSYGEYNSGIANLIGTYDGEGYVTSVGGVKYFLTRVS